MENETFCSVLWNHQMVDGTGRVKPCCRFLEDYRPKDHTLDNYSIQEIFDSDFQNDLRKRILAGERLKGCTRCYEEEDNNKKSLRMRLNEHPKVGAKTVDTENYKLEYLELSLSNDCNLMCRMCDSRYSFKLFDEEQEYHGKTFVGKAIGSEPGSKIKHTKANLDSIYPHLKDMKYIKFTGGEPLIIKDHWKLIEHAVEKGYAKNIRLNYSTNCTVWPKKKIVDIWKEFDHIELAVSLDSIVKEENEYQRHLTNHENALKNINKYVEIADTVGMTVVARPTITIYNAYHLPETLEWLDDRNIMLNPTHLTFPLYLSLTVLPHSQKDIIKQKYHNYNYKNETIKNLCDYILTYMYSEDKSNILDKFKSHTAFWDKSRSQDFKTVYPYYTF